MARLVWLLAAVPVLAQPPTFKSGTNLVQTTAVVRNVQGNAVGDLTAADFELFDNGKRQAISTFSVEKLEHRTPRLLGEGKAAAEKRAVAALPNRFVAFLVDDQNLVPEHFPYAALAAIRSLSNLGPGDRAAVVAASGRMVQEFTDDREKLRHALSNLGSLDRRETFKITQLLPEIPCQITYLKADRILEGDAASMQNCVPPPGAPPAIRTVPVRPGAGVSLAPPGETHEIMLTNQVRAYAESIVQAGDRDVQSYFAGMARLIDAMARMPGERTIVLLSPGMYIAPRFRKLQDEIIAKAVRARVVISGVDPRGVYIRNDPDDPSTWSDQWGLAETNSRIGFMENVTFGTGGTFIRGNNDIDGAIRRLESIPEFVYVLGFSPSELKLDGKYHTLKVSLPRRHGLTVDARRGYYAVERQPDEGVEAERQIRSVFFSDRQLHDLPVRLQLRSSHKPDVSIVLTATARIDLQKAPFRKDGAVNRSNLTLVVGLFDRDGNLVKDFWKEITLHPDDADLASLRQRGVEVSADFEVQPGQYLVRALVRDSEGQAMGTESVGVGIRP